MIDDAFLRQTAALQANLKMLESQQDALSDLADMKELRLYKAHLTDYIEAHSKAGHLPRDPFQVIQQRLIAVSDFFTAADNEYKQLKSWKKDWIKGIPNVSLTTLQSARTELSELLAEIPHAQQRLWQMISASDWDTSSSAVDLHPELLTCAQCADGLKLPSKEGRRYDLYQFARGEGKLMKGVSTHLAAMGQRIDELTQLHEEHAQAIANAETHASNHDFRSAENIFQDLGKDRFSDLDYATAEAQIAHLAGVFKQFTSFESSLDEQLEKGDFTIVKEELAQLRPLIRPDSQLGREALGLLQSMEARLVAAQKSHKKRRVTNLTIILVFIVGFTALSLYVIKENDKAAEAKAKVEAAWAKSSGKRAGEEKVIEIAPGVTMALCWCPAGNFTMGSPKSETNRSDDENQVEVTLSQGFWMSKTEVTQAQWFAVMGGSPSQFKGANRPVENVSWDDAQEFLTKLNVIVGNSDAGQMVLPTEAQWEYACRAGEAGPYSGGTLDQVAWYSGNSGSETHSVGTKKPNAWGLYDMHGNVGEWCADWYARELKGGVDPRGAASGTYRVNRGGSWFFNAYYCRVADRIFFYPSSTNYGVGFRVARSSVP